MADQSEVTALIQRQFPGQRLTPQMVFQILQQNARAQNEGGTPPIPELRGEVPKDPGQPKTTVPKPVAKAASGGESAPTTKPDVTEGPYRGADVGKGPTREDSPDPTRPVPPRNASVGVQSDVAPPVADVNTAIEDDPGPRSVNRADSDRSVTSSPLPTTAQPGSLDMSAIIDQAVAPASPVAAATAPAPVAQQIPQEAPGPQPPVQAMSNAYQPSVGEQMISGAQSMMPEDPLAQKLIAGAVLAGVPIATALAMYASVAGGGSPRTGVYTPPGAPPAAPTAPPTTSAPPPSAGIPTGAPSGTSNVSIGQPPAPPPQPAPAPQATGAAPTAAAQNAPLRSGPPTASYSGIQRAPVGADPNYIRGLQLGPLVDLLSKQQGAGVGGAGDPRLRGQRVPRV